MYFNGMLMLDLWDSDAEYAIFDDFEDWSRFYNYKQFLGAQKEFILTDKYIKKNRWFGESRVSFFRTNTRTFVIMFG